MIDTDLILTYDIGTTGNKCTLFDSEGDMICSVMIAYETIYQKPGWAEQDPEEFWSSTIKGTQLLLEKSGITPSRIAVIGLSGHMNGCIPIDKNGNALYNDIIHSDCRSILECEMAAKTINHQDFYEITGNRLDPHYTLTKIMWLKNNYIDIYNSAEYFINSKDYVRAKLTGKAGITDYSDASLTCMLDLKGRGWAYDMIRELGIDKDKLPALASSYDIVGSVTSEAAALLGLLEGIPVVAGGGDGACSTRGAGAAWSGDAYNYIGSSSWICTLNDAPMLDAKGRNFNFFDLDGKHNNACGTVQCAAISYNWVLENIGRKELELAKKSAAKSNEKNYYDYIDDIAADVPAGANGVIFLPYMMGERTPYWDKNTRGGFIGVSLYNKTPDLFRATYEGIAFALRSVLEVFQDNGLDVNVLTLIGGGARSTLWNGIMSNVYKKPVRVHAFPGEATSLGAAIAAGVGVGIFKSFESASECIRYKRVCEPDDVLSAQYDKIYDVYKDVYPQMKPLFEKMAKF